MKGVRAIPERLSRLAPYVGAKFICTNPDIVRPMPAIDMAIVRHEAATALPTQWAILRRRGVPDPTIAALHELFTELFRDTHIRAITLVKTSEHSVKLVTAYGRSVPISQIIGHRRFALAALRTFANTNRA